MPKHNSPEGANLDPLSVSPGSHEKKPDLSEALELYSEARAQLMDNMDVLTPISPELPDILANINHAERMVNAAARREALVQFLFSNPDDEPPETFGLPPEIASDLDDDFSDVVLDIDKLDELL